MGRKPKYKSKEEKAIAQRILSKAYYHANKKEILTKSKRERDLLRKLRAAGEIDF